MKSYDVSASKFTKKGFPRWSAALAFLIDKAQREGCTVQHDARTDGMAGTWSVLFTDKGATTPTRIYTIVEHDE